MSSIESAQVPLRVQCAVYGVGMFSTTMHFMAMTIVPLWVVQLELSPFILGIVLGCRPVLPLLYSIHTGVLMDRIGAKRVLMFFAILGLITPLLYPTMPFVWAIIVFQLMWGIADAMGWLGAQILVGQLMQGRAIYAGRLSFISRVGNIVGPLLVGAAWDIAGPSAAFGVASAWGMGAVISVLMLPALTRQDSAQSSGAGDVVDPSEPKKSVFRILVPNLSDYTSAFRLLAIPTVAITAAIGMMVHMGNNIQGTFYVVWLNQMGISGTLIGVLIAISSFSASLGSLLAAPLARFFRPYWLLWSVVFVALILIAITPLFGSFVVLAVVLSLRTALNGVHQPLVISLMLKSAGTESHGKVMGLRATANRVTSVGAPIMMGAVAEFIGIEQSFYLMGAIAVLAMVMVAWTMTRHPEIHTSGRDI